MSMQAITTYLGSLPDSRLADQVSQWQAHRPWYKNWGSIAAVVESSLDSGLADMQL